MSEETKVNEPLLPPYPEPFFEWTDEQKKSIKYTGELDHMKHRLGFKLFNLWLMWTDLRANEKLIKIINKPLKDKTKKEDINYLKNVIVETIDRLAKILGNTNITEELLYTKE